MNKFGKRIQFFFLMTTFVKKEKNELKRHSGKKLKINHSGAPDNPFEAKEGNIILLFKECG